MNKNVEHWSGWWWACGNLLYYSLCFYVLFEHSHTVKSFFSTFFKSLWIYCFYCEQILHTHFTGVVSVECAQCWSQHVYSSWPVCGWVLLVPSWYLKNLRSKETSHLAKDSRQWRWGKSSHTMEVSATHIVWCLSKYYCTWACLFHCHLQYFSASCFARKMNQPAPLCLSKITKQNKKGLRTILVWWRPSWL